jgi:AcrR family transcriptional regulator
VPKVSQSYLDARRAEILDAAVACFAREGFHRATMQDIVKESSLSAGAIYNYFKSKEEIVEAIADERHGKEQNVIREAGKEATVEGALRRIRDFFFGGLKNPRERLRRRVSIQLWAEAQRNPKILKIIRRGIDEPRALLKNILSDAQERGEISDRVDPDATARFLIAAFHGLALQIEWDSQLPVQPQIRLLDFFLGSLSTGGRR